MEVAVTPARVDVPVTPRVPLAVMLVAETAAKVEVPVTPRVPLAVTLLKEPAPVVVMLDPAMAPVEEIEATVLIFVIFSANAVIDPCVTDTELFTVTGPQKVEGT